MRKLIKGITVIFVAVFMISMNSCENVDEVIPLPSMKATVDGAAWTSLFRLSVLNESASPQNIVITGTPTANKTADKAIILTVFATEVGTYSLAPGTLTGDCAVVYKKTADATEDGDNYYVAYKATVTISTMDKEKKQMSGTFSATLRSMGNLLDELIITNGTFENLNYQVN